MNRKALVAGTAGLALVVLAVALAWPRQQTYVRAFENVLGTSMELKVRASSSQAAEAAEAAALAEIDREAKILSGYNASSEFSQWFNTTGEPRNVSNELFDVLNRFDIWRVRTNGALDPSAETISRVWKTAAAAHRVPTDTEIAAAVAEVHQPHWRLDPAARTATHLTTAPIILNSFTKSYIVDRAASAAMSVKGVSGVVVNIGGDLVTRGRTSETVAITDPQANADNAAPLMRVAVADRAVATSGVYRRGFDINGVHYSHIVDPRTGRPTGHVLSATVIAREAADAGALATAMCVMTPEESEAAAATVPGAEFMLVLADGRRIESAGWRQLVAVPAKPMSLPQPVATLHAAEQTWNAGFELTIGLEIATQARRAERPYLAVWIEDKDRFPVRTIAVWYRADHSKWLADLKSWYRGDRLRNLAEGNEIIGSVSSATRGPGKYTLVWDGKDNAGKPVKAGTYTVYIEVAREHGTYQIVKQTMDFSGVPKKVDLPGNTELASATLDYHRTAGK
jgi:thiamine biosynthesis lipoprotein ApbE